MNNQNFLDDVPSDGGYGGIIQGWQQGGANYQPLSSVNRNSDFFTQQKAKGISESEVMELLNSAENNHITRVRPALIFKNLTHRHCGYRMLKFVAFEEGSGSVWDALVYVPVEVRSNSNVLVCANPACRKITLTRRSK